MFKRVKKYTDLELLEIVQKGDSNEALTYLYKNVQPKVTKWISQNNGSIEEAQDIFQDSVIVFYKYVTQQKFKENESIEGFIFSVAKNKWINRAKQRQKTTHLPATFSIADEGISYKESDLKNIELLLEKLGQACKELLTYSVFYKMSMEDIALRMNYSNANAVKTKNYKCKQRLVKLVKDKKSLMNFLYHE